MQKKNSNNKKQKLNATVIVVAIIKLVQEVIVAWLENR